MLGRSKMWVGEGCCPALPLTTRVSPISLHLPPMCGGEAGGAGVPGLGLFLVGGWGPLGLSWPQVF